MRKVPSKDGTSIAYERSGQGPSVILVGGAFIYRVFPKTGQLAELMAERFTFINYDRRGRGDSSDGESSYAVEREIEDLEALIEIAGGSASLVGWSSGAVLAMRAAKAGLRIDRLVLYEPPFLVDRSREAPPVDFQAQLERLVGAGRHGDAVKLYMTTGMGAPGPFVTMMRLMPSWKRLTAVANTLPYDWEILGDNLAGRPLVAREWDDITTPTLVMAGSKSPLQLRNAARAVARVLPHARHRELKSQSHNPSMKVQAPAIIEFLEGPAPEGGTHSPIE